MNRRNRTLIVLLVAVGLASAATYFVYEREIRRSEQSEILTILFVDALDIFGDHQLDSGAEFGVRRMFATASLPATLAADARDKASVLYRRTTDRRLSAALEPEIRKLAEGLVEEKADVRGRDLVG